MVLRHNHYEIAFEEYVRDRCIPYVAVDERRRALLAESSLKSMDFIVYGQQQQQNLLIDIKGRQFPTGDGQTGQTGNKWVNWATSDDVYSLLKWQQVFGDQFTALLVFAYDVLSPRWHEEFEELFEFNQHIYSFYGIRVEDYYLEMKRGSTSWDTWFVKSATYRKLCRPLHEFLGESINSSPVNLVPQSTHPLESSSPGADIIAHS